MKHGVLGSFKSSSLKELKKSLKIKEKIKKQKEFISLQIEPDIEEEKSVVEVIIVEEEDTPLSLSELLNNIHEFEEASKELDIRITDTEEVPSIGYLPILGKEESEELASVTTEQRFPYTDKYSSVTEVPSKPLEMSIEIIEEEKKPIKKRRRRKAKIKTTVIS